jgi:hypothetical protein
VLIAPLRALFARAMTDRREGRAGLLEDHMALSYKTRRRLSLLILVIGLPLYIVVAVNLVDLIDRPSVLVELAIYLGLGFVWMMPLRSVFRGIGQPDPDQPPPD